MCYSQCSKLIKCVFLREGCVVDFIAEVVVDSVVDVDSVVVDVFAEVVVVDVIVVVVVGLVVVVDSVDVSSTFNKDVKN